MSVASLLAANGLLAVPSLCDIEDTTGVPDSYSRNLGKIKRVPLDYSDAELLEYLQDFGVMSVQRQITYRRQDDVTVEQNKTESVILHFRTDLPMPQLLLMGVTSHPMEKYFGPPVQCFHCQMYSQIANFCHGSRSCKMYSWPRSYKVSCIIPNYRYITMATRMGSMQQRRI